MIISINKSVNLKTKNKYCEEDIQVILPSEGVGGAAMLEEEKSVTSSDRDEYVYPETGYDGFKAIKVNKVPIDTESRFDKNGQYIAQSGKWFKTITVDVPVPEGYLQADGTAMPENVLLGKTFINASGALQEGTMPIIKTEPHYLNGATGAFIIPKGYHDGGGTVIVEYKGRVSVTPTKEAQTVSYKDYDNYFFREVLVESIPPEYYDTSDALAEPSYVREGEVFYNNNGRQVGTMPEHYNLSAYLTSDSAVGNKFDIPEGYHDGKGFVVAPIAVINPVTPTNSYQTITAPDQKFFSSIKINPIPDNYIKLLDDKEGDVIIDVVGIWQDVSYYRRAKVEIPTYDGSVLIKVNE